MWMDERVSTLIEAGQIKVLTYKTVTGKFRVVALLHGGRTVNAVADSLPGAFAEVAYLILRDHSAVWNDGNPARLPGFHSPPTIDGG